MGRAFALVCAIGLLTGCQQSTPPEEKASLPVRDGPLGLAMGQDPKEVGGVPMEGRPGWYKVPVAPKPHPVLVDVQVLAGPTTGICRIDIEGRHHENDENGRKVVADIRRLAADLSVKYGKEEPFDACARDSSTCPNAPYIDIISGPWPVDLYGWDASKEKPFPQNVTGIILFPQVDEQRRTYATLRYFFANKGECDAEIEKIGASSL